MKKSFAFPIHQMFMAGVDAEDVEVMESSAGLTKREYFAAMAMQGVCASSSAWKVDWHAKDFAKSSLVLADALIAELEKTK